MEESTKREESDFHVAVPEFQCCGVYSLCDLLPQSFIDGIDDDTVIIGWFASKFCQQIQARAPILPFDNRFGHDRLDANIAERHRDFF